MGINIGRPRFYRVTQPQMELGPQIGDEGAEVVWEDTRPGFVVRVIRGKFISTVRPEDGPRATTGLSADSEKEYPHNDKETALKDFERRCEALRDDGFSE